ncbi:MAG: dihydrodipicolinate synthase family protein [Bryobacteraceae bacterium]|nr:dihydrodipicolinate synthase family protein [Solibacteraceae bacterium]MCO5350533.1 dihydrodipicolinate synthase family protein [Bryobacteraceae bacterium]
MPEFEGIVPAVVTPLDGEGGLKAGSLERLLGRLYRAGSEGVYVCGQTGEGLQLPLEVREQAVEVAVAQTPAGRTVIAHVGAANTADAVRLARHAGRAGAQAVSSLPPGSAYSFEEVWGYYERLVEEAGVPVLVYYFPEFSAAIRTTEQVLELCAIPGVIGLKFTDFDLYRMSILSREGYTIYNGRDEVLAAGLLMGAHGGIGSFYNLIPELFVELYGHARAGRWSEARAGQDRINELIRAVLRFPLLAAIKSLLRWSGIDCGAPVPPRRVLTPEEEGALREAVQGAGFAPDGFLA